MKRQKKWLSLLLLGLSCSLVYAHGQAEQASAPATDWTRKAQQEVRNTLPFHDRQDFADARRGFVAADDPLTIRNAAGRPVWDMEQYKRYIAENTPAPDTVNPSLWRMAQLNMFHGLFKVTDRIYQVRGYDLSNITFIQGDTGWIVFDPLISAETARAALALINKHVGTRPVVAVLYSHSHVDHYGGVRGVVEEKDVLAGKIPIFAPQGFTEHAVSENVIAGNAMGRRATYMYGSLLPRNPQGSVGSGLGMTTSSGASGFIAPTHEIRETQERHVVDGVEMVFQMTPGTEAPAEMNTWFPQFKALWMAENACNTMHNLLTLRGAQVRDPLQWSKYLAEALELWGESAQVRFQAHHWPRWGTENIVAELKKQRDVYKYIHDQSVRRMNQGYTGAEIAESLALPDSLGQVWANRGYYGTLRHNSRAVYQRYMGWYSGHPSDLDNLPPQEAGKKYVAFMGGEAAVLQKARQSFADGEYRWVAEVLKHLVFANPESAAGRALLADALEQLGYQAESGAWRNVYLQGAWELRNGLPRDVKASGAKADTARSMTPEMLFDYLAVRLDAQKADGKNLSVNITLADTGEGYTLFLENSVLNYTRRQWKNADLCLTLSNTALASLLFDNSPQTLRTLQEQGAAQVTAGEESTLPALFDLLDDFSFWFPIVTP